MKFNIKFDNPEQAKEFAEILRENNLRGLRIKQAHKKAEEGALNGVEYADVLELTISLGTLVIKSGVIPLTIREIHKFYKTYQETCIQKLTLVSEEKRKLAEIKSVENQKLLEATTKVVLKQEEIKQKKEEEQKRIDDNKEDKEEDGEK